MTSKKQIWNDVRIVFAVASFLSVTSVSALAGGGESGGGGAQIESAFRLQGYELISKIADNPQANDYCGASKLENTLDSTKISVVSELVNPNSGKPITQILDAWTVPGHIQLLEGSWQNLIGIHAHPYKNKITKSVDVLILHEIYRSTGTCDDNNFKISEKVFSLLSGNAVNNYSEVFVFTHAYVFNNSGSADGVGVTPFPYNNGDTVEACDTAPNQIKIDKSITCFVNNGSGTVVKNIKVIALGGGYVGPGGFQVSYQYQVSEGLPLNTLDDDPDVNNQIQEISPQHPMILMHDIQNGTWSLSIK